jgi:hypothetical protein
VQQEKVENPEDADKGTFTGILNGCGLIWARGRFMEEQI